MARAEPASAGSLRVALARASLCAGLLALALGVWWSWPRANAVVGKRLNVVLVDASRSARAPRPDWAAWMRREIESVRARDPATELSCVRFGERALRLAPEDLEGASSTSERVPAASGGEESGDASELARALELAAELARVAHAGGGRIVILGDGGFTGVDPRAALDELARAGFEIEARRLPRATIDDLALDDLQAPRFVREGEACLVRAGLWLAAADDAPRDARIDVRIESAAGARELSFDSPLPPGSARDSSGCAHWSAPLALGVLEPGWNRVELRARIVEHDRERGSERPDADSENDSLSLSIACGERPLVLLAGRAGPALESLESELRASALVTLARIEPRALRSRLPGADVLVTAALEAGEAPLAELAAYLRSAAAGSRSRTSGWPQLRRRRDRAQGPALLPRARAAAYAASSCSCWTRRAACPG